MGSGCQSLDPAGKSARAASAGFAELLTFGDDYTPFVGHCRHTSAAYWQLTALLARMFRLMTSRKGEWADACISVSR
jgi:hypothetical protein